jgi:hypothetical protein
MDVDALFAQQLQSKHSPAQSPNGSSDGVEQIEPNPSPADAKHISRNTAARFAIDLLTIRLYHPPVRCSSTPHEATFRQ